MKHERAVFIVSDRTGITAETLGHSLLTQFDSVEFKVITVPFLNTADKAKELARKIDASARATGGRPLVFSTLVKDDVRDIIAGCDALLIDFFDTFIEPLESELGVRSTHTTGKAHGMSDLATYTSRIEAMNFALANDDGVTTRHYEAADIVLVGVSRSGKTPTCLYMALQFGLYAANFPLTEDDLEHDSLPDPLREHLDRLYGLTIDPGRLTEIRQERRPDSRYAANDRVSYEVRGAEALFRASGIPYLNTTRMSIEEIAATILHTTGIKRRFFT